LHTRCFGLDINPFYLSFTALTQPDARLILGDAHDLPLAGAYIDVCLCHFFLLWVTDPARVLQEMCRITRPGGVVMALAEPDYGSRIDYPQELSILGEWQRESLLRQGADPLFGRKIRSIFSRSGLVDVEAGVMGGEWIMSSMSEHESEWAVLRSDLANDPDKSRKLDDLIDIDAVAWERGDRILYVPTFYAWGRVPK
jgi:ubiquinone/menaquinone biosynthesis C-methylase UbiE